VVLFVVGLGSIRVLDRAGATLPGLGRGLSAFGLVLAFIWGTICMGAGLQVPVTYVLFGLDEIPMSEIPATPPAWLAVSDGQIDLSRTTQASWVFTVFRKGASPESTALSGMLAPVVTSADEEGPWRVWACANDTASLTETALRGAVLSLAR
jgi:hypothetical protein